MTTRIQQIEWIVKTALTDDSIPSDRLIQVMKDKEISSGDLLDYINNDGFWPMYDVSVSSMISSHDEKYIIDFKNPGRKQAIHALREKAREAVHYRFYSGRKFSEWEV